MAKSKTPKRITILTHTQAKRTNIPTAEHQSVMNSHDLAARKLRDPREPEQVKAFRDTSHPITFTPIPWHSR